MLETRTFDDDNDYLMKQNEYVERLKTNEELFFSNEGLSEFSNITGQFNKLLENQYSKDDSNMSFLNSLLKKVISMDYVREMIEEVNEQVDIIHDITENSSEMQKSIEYISEYVQDTTTSAQSVVDDVSTSLGNIETTINNINILITEFGSIMDNILNVSKKMGVIENIIDTITRITTTIDLLAINASIQAVHAGEAGKGFKIIANEIKSLSSNTKESLGVIREATDELNQEVVTLVDQVGTAENEITAGSKNLKNSISMMNEIGGNLNGILNNIVDISHGIEEQTAVSKEISSSMVELNNRSDKINDKSQKTGIAFYEISSMINKYRVNFWTGAWEKSESRNWDTYEIDHLMWRWRVYNMVLGYEKLDSEALGRDHTQCRLGKWLSNYITTDSEVLHLINELQYPHRKLHSTAVEAAEAYERENKEKLQEKLNDIDKYSKFVSDYVVKLNQASG